MVGPLKPAPDKPGDSYLLVNDRDDPLARPPKPPFDREWFVFKILAVVIGTHKLLLALLGVAALTPPS